MPYGLSDQSLTKILGVLSTYPQIDKAILFGSRAKGNFKNGSDIDLSLLGERIDFNILNKLSRELDDLLLPYHIDLSSYNRIKDPDLKSHILRVGKVIYSKQS